MFYSKKLKTFKNLKHCFFSRKGGFSKGIYASLNCGRGSGDSKKNLSNNFKLIAKKMNTISGNLVLMHQTHSNKVIEIKKKNFKKKIFSDAIITKIKGIALCVVTADCVPILLFDPKSKIIGCVHAGWKGAFSGIIKNTVIKMKNYSSSNKIYACIGPCIGFKNYEVDIKFFNKFIKQSKKNNKYFKKKNNFKKLFNLRKFVTDLLLELGVEIDHVNRDTFKEKNYFFSYRRSLILKERDYGRCLSAISLV